MEKNPVVTKPSDYSFTREANCVVKPLPSANFGTAPRVSTLPSAISSAPNSAVGNYDPFKNYNPPAKKKNCDNPALYSLAK